MAPSWCACALHCSGAPGLSDCFLVPHMRPGCLRPLCLCLASSRAAGELLSSAPRRPCPRQFQGLRGTYACARQILHCGRQRIGPARQSGPVRRQLCAQRRNSEACHLNAAYGHVMQPAIWRACMWRHAGRRAPDVGSEFTTARDACCSPSRFHTLEHGVDV